MKKRFFSFFLTIALVLVLIPVQSAKALVFTPNCAVASEAAVLMNLDVGTIVYEKNADMKEMPATLTQVMAAVLVLEQCPNPSTELVTANGALFEAIHAYEYQTDLRYANINAGDTLTVEDLLYAMLLTSSCEAAVMLADHFGGETAFVQKMNEKAVSLGMSSTRFTNVAGFYSARQVTTARDMIHLLQYAMTVPRFETMACANAYTPPSAASLGKSEKWAWTHSNTMYNSKDRYYCAGTRGIKTGNLQAGGRVIACKASRDGNNYLLVCLNAPMYDADGSPHFYHLEDAKNIIEWAFAHLRYQKLLTTGTEIDEVDVANADGNDFVIVKPATGFSCVWCDTSDIRSIQQIVTLEENVKAPVQAGDKLGTIQLKLSGEVLADIDLIAASSVKRSFWKYNLSIIPGFLHSGFLKTAWVTALVLTLLYLITCIGFRVYHQQQKRKRPQRVHH